MKKMAIAMKRRTKRRKRQHRLQLQQLETRRLLVAPTDLAQISGVIFDDTNTNAIFDVGEPGINGATVELFLDNGNSVFDAGDSQILPNQTTNGAGQYTFANRTAGSYFVRQPAQTTPSGRTLPEEISPLIIVSAAAAAGQLQTTIDTFDGATQTAFDDTNDGVAVTSFQAAPEAIGGERDLIVNKTSVNGAVQINVDSPLLPNLLTFDSISTGNGDRRVVWDGVDGAAAINDNGLSADLTSAGSATGLSLDIGADLAGGAAIVRIYSDDGGAGATRFSSATIPIPNTGGGTTMTEFVPFSSFITGGGGGADFTNVGAIELDITGVANLNGTAALVGAIGPTVFTQNFDNLESSDLSLTKTVNDLTPNIGQTVTYTITVSNAGPSTATGVQVTDAIPAGTTFAGATPSQGTFDPNTGIWTVGTLGANAGGNTAQLTLNATVNTSGVITNTAQVSASNQSDPDSTPGNNIETEDDQQSVTITPQSSDLSLTKTVNDTTPNVGQTITYTVTVNNAGPSSATGVQVTDPLPAGTTFISSAPSQGTFNPATGIWTVGTLGATAGSNTAQLMLNATVNTTGAITNTAQISASNQSDPDSTPGNNIATEDDQQSVTIIPESIDLSLTKSVNNPSPNVGDTIAFTVSVTNSGTSTATGVQIQDNLPAGLAFVSASATNGSTFNNGTGIWNLGTLGPGLTTQLTINATVTASGSQTNTAQVIAANESDIDSTPGNNLINEDDQDSAIFASTQADLSITKSVNNPSPNVGENVIFTIAVQNTGPDTATGVTVSDLLPAGLTFVSSSQGGAYNPTTGVWTVGSVTPGVPLNLSITARVDTVGVITNTAQIQSSDQNDPDSTPNNNAPGEDDQASVSLTPATANLSLTKTVNNASPNVGEPVTFTITVSNAGPNVATGVSVRDQLPAGITFTSSSTPNFNSATGIWNVGTIPVGGSQSFNLVGTATTSGLATNTAEIIAADQFDPNSTPGNGIAAEDDQASAQIQSQQIDLSLTKTVDNASPNVGEEINFVISVSNAGPSTATGVQVTEVLPTGVTFISSTPSLGSFNTTTGVWTVGTLVSGTTQTLGIRARVDSVLNASNTAQVTAADQEDIDSTPANNVPGEDDQASVAFSTPQADLSLTKTVNNASPNTGDTVTYLVTLNNAGPDAATGVNVTDLLPSGVQFVSNNLSVGSYNPATGLWNVGSLAAGNSATLELIGTVNSLGETTNTAQVSAADQADPDSTPANNIASEDDQASISFTTQQIDLSLDKIVSNERPAIGESFTYTVTVTNSGNDTATGVQVTDQLPEGVTFVSSQPAALFNPSTGIWTVGTIAPGASSSLQITAIANTPGVQINSAQVTAADQADIDSTPGNNVASEDDQDSVSITPASADLSLTKTVDDPSPNVGQQVTFNISVSNAGPDPASSIDVLDSLPAGLTLLSANPATGTFNPATGLWSIPTLGVGASSTLVIQATVDAVGDISNTAEIIASSQFDPDSTPANNDVSEDDQDSAALSPELVDLALAKIVDDPNPNVGDTIAYTLTLSNDGPSTATGVQVTDLLPAGLTFVNALPSLGTYNAANGIWQVGSVATGATPTLVLNATVGNTEGITNTAEITAVDQPDSDSTPGNNVAAEDDQASVAFETQIADLSLTKTVDNATPGRDDEITFTLTLSNAGPNTATDVVVSDLLPPGLRFVSSNPSIGTYDATNGRWTVPSVPVGAVATLQITTALTGSDVTINTAEIISARQFDIDSTPGNNVAAEDDIATAEVDPQVVDISVTGTVDNAEPLEGESIQITFTATNSGPDNATNVNLRTLLPDGLTLLSSQPLRGSYNSVTGEWTLGDLAAGEATQLVLNARVDSRGIRNVPIEVISTDQFDFDSTPANTIEAEDDQTSVLVQAPRLLQKRLFFSR